MKNSTIVYGNVSEIRGAPKYHDVVAPFGERVFCVLSYGERPEQFDKQEYDVARIERTAEHDEGRYSAEKVSFKILELL